MISATGRAALIGAVVAALATLPGLGVGTLWDNSETAYGEVAREILLTHDPIVMHLNGAAWFVQPPLYFWFAAAFAKLFGVSEFALRLPSALATIAMAAAVAYVVARVASARAATLSAAVLSTGLMQAVVGRLAIMDALLDLAVAAAILAWFVALRGGRAGFWYAGWFAIGLGLLAKGLVAPVAVALVVGPWALVEARGAGRIAWPSPRAWVGGVALCVATIAPWSLALYATAGGHAFYELIGHYTVGRYLGTIENQSGPVWYYVPVVVLGFFPWFAFLVPAALDGVRRARRSEPDAALARLALAWTIVPFVFFSLAKTKLPNYIALELPAFAILVGLWFDRTVARADRRVALVWTALVPVTIAGLAFAMWAFSHDNRLTADLQQIRGPFAALGGVIFLGSVACFALLAIRRVAWLAPYALAAASIVDLVIIALVGEPVVERFKPIPNLAAAIDRERRPSDVVAIQGVSGGNALVFYTRPKIAELSTASDALASDASTDPRRAICGAPRALVVTSKRRPSPDPTYGRARRLLATANNDVLFLYDGPPCQVAPATARAAAPLHQARYGIAAPRVVSFEKEDAASPARARSASFDGREGDTYGIGDRRRAQRDDEYARRR